MRRLVPMLALVAAVAGPLAAPPAADAATGSTHARVVAVAADAAHLVYKRQVSTRNLTPQPQKGDVLYATDTAGRVTALPDFHGASVASVSLVGDLLVQASGGGGGTAQQVHWRNLLTGATGQVGSKDSDALKSAAPDGWVVQRTGVTRPASAFALVRVRTDGSETDLGVPFPDYGDGGVGYLLATSDSGLIAYPIQVDDACASSQVKFQPWSDPGGWRTVFPGTRGSCIRCAPASASGVACTVVQPDEGLVEISLRGGAPHYLRHSDPTRCQTVDYATSDEDLVAVETTDAGTCTRGVVYRFGRNRKVAVSTARYSALGSIRTGLGRIVVSKGQQGAVYGLSGATRAPVVVARG